MRATTASAAAGTAILGVDDEEGGIGIGKKWQITGRLPWMNTVFLYSIIADPVSSNSLAGLLVFSRF